MTRTLENTKPDPFSPEEVFDCGEWRVRIYRVVQGFTWRAHKPEQLWFQAKSARHYDTAGRCRAAAKRRLAPKNVAGVRLLDMADELSEK